MINRLNKSNSNSSRSVKRKSVEIVSGVDWGSMRCTIGGAPRGGGGFDSIESAQKVKGRHHNRDLLENCCTLKIEGCTIGGAPRGKVFTEEAFQDVVTSNNNQIQGLENLNANLKHKLEITSESAVINLTGYILEEKSELNESSDDMRGAR